MMRPRAPVPAALRACTNPAPARGPPLPTVAAVSAGALHHALVRRLAHAVRLAGGHRTSPHHAWHAQRVATASAVASPRNATDPVSQGGGRAARATRHHCAAECARQDALPPAETAAAVDVARAAPTASFRLVRARFNAQSARAGDSRVWVRAARLSAVAAAHKCARRAPLVPYTAAPRSGATCACRVASWPCATSASRRRQKVVLLRASPPRSHAGVAPPANFSRQKGAVSVAAAPRASTPSTRSALTRAPAPASCAAQRVMQTLPIRRAGAAPPVSTRSSRPTLTAHVAPSACAAVWGATSPRQAQQSVCLAVQGNTRHDVLRRAARSARPASGPVRARMHVASAPLAAGARRAARHRPCVTAHVHPEDGARRATRVLAAGASAQRVSSASRRSRWWAAARRPARFSAS